MDPVQRSAMLAALLGACLVRVGGIACGGSAWTEHVALSLVVAGLAIGGTRVVWPLVARALGLVEERRDEPSGATEGSSATPRARA